MSEIITIRQLSKAMGIPIEELLDMPISGPELLNSDVQEKLKTYENPGGPAKEFYTASQTIRFEMHITKHYKPQFYE